MERWRKRPEFEFYDVKNDPYELRNLAHGSEYSDTMSQMFDQLQSFMKQQGDKGIETELSNKAYVGKWSGRKVIE